MKVTGLHHAEGFNETDLIIIGVLFWIGAGYIDRGRPYCDPESDY